MVRLISRSNSSVKSLLGCLHLLAGTSSPSCWGCRTRFAAPCPSRWAGAQMAGAGQQLLARSTAGGNGLPAAACSRLCAPQSLKQQPLTCRTAIRACGFPLPAAPLVRYAPLPALEHPHACALPAHAASAALISWLKHCSTEGVHPLQMPLQPLAHSCWVLPPPSTRRSACRTPRWVRC